MAQRIETQRATENGARSQNGECYCYTTRTLLYLSELEVTINYSGKSRTQTPGKHLVEFVSSIPFRRIITQKIREGDIHLD